MKPRLLSLLAVIFTNIIFAQDNIILRNGDEIKARVEEVGIGEIKYKRSDNLNGPLYTILKNQVFMIKYENGTKDVFNATESSTLVSKHPMSKAEVATGGDYNKLYRLGIKRIVGGAVMIGVGAPVLLGGLTMTGIAINQITSDNYYNYPNPSTNGNGPQLVAGGFFTVAGIVLEVVGAITLKKGIYYRKLAKQNQPVILGFTPSSNHAIDRYSQTMNHNKVGVTLTF